MTRMPDEKIAIIKQNVSLLNWIESEGHEPKKEGNDYVMACIFHNDKTPSLKITPRKNLYHCFGCGASGSIIDWVMKTKTLDFRAAVTHIEKQSGALKHPTSATIQTAQPSLPAEISGNDQKTTLQCVIEHYHSCLKNDPDALAYLESRGLNDPDLIDTFKLGFSNKSLTSTLAAKHSQTGKQQRQCLQASGALKKSGYEHFAGCLVVPIYNQGHCVEIYGRRIQPYSDPKHLYLPGSHVGVWNLAGFKQTDTIILCEALIDAMTFWVNGFKHVTASYGTAGFIEDHLTQLKTNNITKVLIAYDRDKAGNEAAEQLAEKLNVQNIHCYRINFPKNMDANSFSLQVKPAKKSLALVIEKAEPMLGSPTLASSSPIPSLAAKPAESAAKKPEQSPLIVTDTEVSLHCGGRHYRVRGLQNNTRLDQLKINLLSKLNDETHYVDNLDLYQAKARKHYIASAADEMGIDATVIKKDLGKLLLALEAYQEQQLNGQVVLDKNKPMELTEDQKKQALDFLTDKNLIQRIINDIQTIGIIGEENNALVSYLACVSRKLDKPLAIMIQSTSAAGKSALMDSVLSLMPEEQQHKFAAMTGQSLYYMSELGLKHNILAIAEEEGAHSASYALKLLQSEGEVSIASTGKNETTGNLETKTYQVEGPVMLMMTTTAIDIDEELMNRCLVLSVNESQKQTQAIHALQRKKRTLNGLKQTTKKQTLIDQHHAAQRLLRSLAIINPYAEQLTFLSNKTRTRRDHEKYLTLIDSITLLHQYQRKIHHLSVGEKMIEYIEVTLDDIKIANELAHDVLSRSLDELPPQTRKLLELISQMVVEKCQKDTMEQSDYRFSRKQIRDRTGWGNTQIRVHCERLTEMEYLMAHQGKRGRCFEYELLHSSLSEQNCHSSMNLIDEKILQTFHEKNSTRGDKHELTVPKRPQNGGLSVPKRAQKNASKTISEGLTAKVSGLTQNA